MKHIIFNKQRSNTQARQDENRFDDVSATCGVLTHSRLRGRWLNHINSARKRRWQVNIGKSYWTPQSRDQQDVTHWFPVDCSTEIDCTSRLLGRLQLSLSPATDNLQRRGVVESVETNFVFAPEPEGAPLPWYFLNGEREGKSNLRLGCSSCVRGYWFTGPK